VKKIAMVVSLFGIALSASACDSAAVLFPRDVAGVYTLRSVSGLDEPPSVGVLRLQPNGEVERRLRFGDEEVVWFGRYRVRGSTLEIAFRAAGITDGPLHYSPVAYESGLIVLRYGRPADGPDVIEVYEADRQMRAEASRGGSQFDGWDLTHAGG
jgi:hypothetical protein